MTPRWRSMKSAPRDGTEVLIIARGYFSIACFDVKRRSHEWVGRGGTRVDAGIVDGWMPLPPPPVKLKKGKK